MGWEARGKNGFLCRGKSALAACSWHEKWVRLVNSVCGDAARIGANPVDRRVMGSRGRHRDGNWVRLVLRDAAADAASRVNADGCAGRMVHSVLPASRMAQERGELRSIRREKSETKGNIPGEFLNWGTHRGPWPRLYSPIAAQQKSALGLGENSGFATRLEKSAVQAVPAFPARDTSTSGQCLLIAER